MRRIIVGFFAVVGVLSLLVAVILAVGVWRLAGSHVVPVADHTVLEADFTQAFTDAPPSGGISQIFSAERPSLRDVVDALDKAGNDPKVAGLVAHIGDGEFATAQAQELRDAIAAFRAKGKRAVAYADSFGELGSGTKSYYLAASFDEIWVQPLGIVGLVGLRAEVPFFKGSLDKLGLAPHFDHREEYKTAMNSLTESSITPPHREEMQALLSSAYTQIVTGIASDRKIDVGQVKALVDRGPLLAEDALKAKLIDHIGYRDEATAALTAAVKGEGRPLALHRYLERAGRPHKDGPTIALIYATGLITQGGSSGSPLGGSQSLGADSLIQAFRTAERDKEVRAILFRINSPGGSAVASESIWRETERARKAGKPIIVSMGDVAGSGGYYIAASADKIVAEPATLTGSIGVVAGKMVIDGLLQKLGVTWDAAQVGANADIESAMTDFSPVAYSRFEAFLDNVYAGFKERVADGRKMAPDAVEEVAKGRVWSGEDAKARGLVDALGGYDTALALAKSAAGIAADQEVTVKLYPPAADPAQRLLARLTGREDDEEERAKVTMLEHALSVLGPVLQQVDLMSSGQGTVVMAPIEIK
jgi:protease-4